MDCKKASEILFLFFDNELDGNLRRPFEEHLALCPGCAHRLDYTKKLLVLVRSRSVRHFAPPRLRVRILTSLPHRQV
jgi:anti-sigma factor (TIGR02949 family)